MGIVVKVLFVLLLMIVIASFAFKEIKDVIPAKTLIWIKVISVILVEHSVCYCLSYEFPVTSRRDYQNYCRKF